MQTHAKKSAEKAIKDSIWNLFWDNFMHGDAAEEFDLWKYEELINIIILNSTHMMFHGSGTGTGPFSI